MSPMARSAAVHGRGAPQDACPICGAAPLTAKAPFPGKPHRVVHCGACGHEAIRPIPSEEELARFYSDYPTTKTSASDLDLLFERSLTYLGRFAADAGIRREDAGALSFLEIGFGNGAAVFAAARFGFRAHGIDMDRSAVIRAKSNEVHYGVRVDCDATSLEDFRPDRRFEVVKASQVIEHVRDPVAFLAAIARRQPPGGFLLIECPNNDGAFWRVKNLLRRRYGRLDYFNALKIGEHLSGFTKESLAILLERSGYELVRCGDYFLRHPWLMPENLSWYPSIGQGLRALVTRRDAYSFLKSLIPAFDRAASAFGRGTHLYAWARKRGP